MTKGPKTPKIADELRRRQQRRDALGEHFIPPLDPTGGRATKVLVAFTDAQLAKLDAARGERSRQEVVRDLIERMPS